MITAVADITFPSIVRTERGLTVNGRRLTLYMLEDHFREGWPPQLVKEAFGLSEQELADVIGYISAHREEFDAEYLEVERQANERRTYWEEQNRLLDQKLRSAPASQDVVAKRAKLEAIRRRRSSLSL
jgi:hypothetical protein